MTAAAAETMAEPPADPLTAYYKDVRQGNIQLAKDRYRKEFKVRTQEFIKGRGTLAVVMDAICMGCTHCFDNCAFEAIDMVDRKFAFPDYSYTSRKAVIIEENCVGCEKCALVCPVDAITMVTKHGFEVKDGRVIQTSAPQKPGPAPAGTAIRIATNPAAPDETEAPAEGS